MNAAGMAMIFDRYNCFPVLSVEHNLKVITLAAMEPGASDFILLSGGQWHNFQTVIHISVMCIGGCSWNLLDRN